MNIDELEKIKKGLFNDAFREASTSYDFCLGNPKFIDLLSNTLEEIGFFSEANSLKDFSKKLAEYRQHNNHASSKHKLENGALDFSNDYGKKGKLELLTNPLWVQRAKIIASHIPKNSKVLDFGCGNMILKDWLDSSIRYVGCDINQRDEDTIVCNFDKEEYPPTVGETIVTCIGVINYLSKQKELVEHICGRTDFFIITIKPNEYIEEKIKNNIFNPSLGLNQIIDIIEKKGFTTQYSFILGKGDEVMIIAKK